LIEFQQFPTFVKRKLEGTNYHEPDDVSSSVQDDNTNLNPNASAAILAVEADGEYGTWGTKTDTTSQDTQNTWGNTSTQKQTRHNSPDLNAYRSGQCTYCDCNIGSKRMHGPLICYECHLLLKEDEAHEKEQQEYNDKEKRRDKHDTMHNSQEQQKKQRNKIFKGMTRQRQTTPHPKNLS
jgi:hypothetical protein